MATKEQISAVGKVRKVYLEKKPYGFYLDTEEPKLKDQRISVWARDDVPREGSEVQVTVNLTDEGYLNLASVEDGNEPVEAKQPEAYAPPVMPDRTTIDVRAKALGCARTRNLEVELELIVAERYEKWLVRPATSGSR